SRNHAPSDSFPTGPRVDPHNGRSPDSHVRARPDTVRRLETTPRRYRNLSTADHRGFAPRAPWPPHRTGRLAGNRRGFHAIGGHRMALVGGVGRLVCLALA